MHFNRENGLPDYGVNEDESVYYGGGYWNDLDAVARMFKQRISGRVLRGPWFHDSNVWNERTFNRALILNCGNGWVERQLVSANLVAEAVGIDYSNALLEEARRAAQDQGLPLRYHQMNVNSVDFPAEEFDLVVNYAAAHHIAMLDRTFREICRLLPEEGRFLSFDYVGPHRNQYTSEAWERAWKVNDELPPRVRQVMSYPHLPTMLRTDPTEAVHSELILETLHRYFHVERFVPLGGAVAYPLLTHNEALFALTDEAEQTKWVEYVLQADDEFLSEHPESTLFAFFVATPKKVALEQLDALGRWRKEENDREERAQRNGGEYYPRTALQDAYIRLIAESQETARLRDETLSLQGQLEDIRSDLLYSRLARLRESRLFTTIRKSRLARRLKGRLR